MWIAHIELASTSVNPFYLLIGYFEGIDSERGIAWRSADSLALRRFVGITLDEYTPDHSTISRTRRLIDVDTHREVFGWVLGVLANRGLLRVSGSPSMPRRWRPTRRCGRSCGATRGELRGVSARTGEVFRYRNADARGSGTAGPQAQKAQRLNELLEAEGFDEFVEGAVCEVLCGQVRAGIAGARDLLPVAGEWKSPADEDARIAKMKDGRTHLAHKAEHAVDLETDAVAAVTILGPNRRDIGGFRLRNQFEMHT